MTKITEFVDLLRTQTDKGIYVWGGDGQNLSAMNDPISWIKKKETSDTNAQRAITLYNKRLNANVNPIQAFDCSGLIYWALKTLGLQKSDVSSRGLYGLCTPIDKSELRAGDLVFKWTDKDGDGFDVSEIYHVGAMIDDTHTIECIGRDSGVVELKYSSKWKAWGRPKWFVDIKPVNPVEPEPVQPDDPSIYWRDLYVTSPYMRGEDVKFIQTSLINGGYSVGKSECDGIYGNDTKNAVLKFQSDSGLVQTGKVDEITWNAILAMNAIRTLMGDANKDGRLTAADASIILRNIVLGGGLSLESGDANNDGIISSTDASYILRCVVGLEKPIYKG